MILFHSTVRDLQRHPWQALLSLVGIALGVAVVLAVDLTNFSADRAMQWSQSTLAQDITHQIVAGPSGVPEKFYVQLRKDLRIRSAIPIVSGPIRIVGSEDRWELLGVDVLADMELLKLPPDTGNQNAIPLRLLSKHNTAIVLEDSAAQLALHKNEIFEIRSNNRIHQLRLTATAKGRDPIQTSALSKIVLTDIATAQEILEMTGHLTRIDLKLEQHENQLQNIRNVLPAGVTLTTITQRTDALAQMTDAFQVNLTALSLLALLLGAFLIFNSMTLSVLRRRQSLAILRALGVKRTEVLLLLLGEAVLLGLIGTTLGLMLGIWLSHGLLGLVARTINDLYFSVELSALTLGSVPFIKSIVLGIGATVAATLLPAIEAVRTPPGPGLTRANVEIHARSRTWLWLAAACASAALTGALFWSFGDNLVLGFVALFTLILAFAFSAPAGLLWFVGLMRPAMVKVLGLRGAMATRGITSTLSRTQVAVAALALAVATSVAVTIMIDSFRTTVNDWLHYYLRADIYIAKYASHNKGIDASIVHRLQRQTGVQAVHTGRWLQLATPEPTPLFAINVDKRGFAAYRLIETTTDDVWESFINKQAIIVSEPFAYHRRLGLGDNIVLPTDRGEQAFRIVAIFEDYGSDRGMVVMHRNTYNKYWRDNTITSLAVYLDPAQDSEQYVSYLQNELRDTGLRIRSNRTLRDLSLSIFDQTFVVTGVLRILAIIIAVIGILSALLAIQLDRRREFAVLRALGLSPGDLRGLLMTESGLLGFSAGVLALPLALAMAWGLIHIINRRAFGWSLTMDVSLITLAGGVLLAAGAAIVAGWYPAQRMARTAPAVDLRYE